MASTPGKPSKKSLKSTEPVMGSSSARSQSKVEAAATTSSKDDVVTEDLITPSTHKARKTAKNAMKGSSPKDASTPSKRGRGRRLAATIDVKTLPGGTPFNCSTAEPKCSAYLGYRDIASFRRFRFSWIVLQAYRRYSLSGCKKKDHKGALDVLEEIKLDDLPLFRSIEHLRTLDGHFKVATILAELAQVISEGKTQPEEDAVDAIHSEFVKDVLTGKSISSIPYTDMETLSFPLLGPFPQFEEHKLEKYNRCWNLLLSLESVLAPSRFNSLFVKAKDPFQSNMINASALPTWMQNAASAKDGTAILKQKPPPSPVCMFYNPARTVDKDFAAYSIDISDRQGGQEFLDRYTNPNILLDAPHDPRDYPNGTMWRDAMRRTMRFPDMAVDFKDIYIGIREKGAPKEIDSISIQKSIKSHVNPFTASTWTEIQKYLRALDPALAIVIGFTLTAVDEEGEDYIFEYEGPPLAIAQDITTDETGDAVFVHPDSGLKGQLATTGKNNDRDQNTESVDTSSKDVLEQLNDLLNAGGVGFSRTKAPTPMERFKLPEEETEFLAYYDGYDVRIPEQLLQWQRETLDRIIGPPIRPNHEKITGTRKVSKQIQEGLKKTVRDAEAEVLKRDERHFEVESAFQGTNINTGPRVDLSKKLLNMTDAGYMNLQGTDFTVSSLVDIPQCEQTFLDSQVNGAAWMMSKCMRNLPQYLNYSGEEKEELTGAFKSVVTRGGVLGDSTGLGKTQTALLWLSIFVRFTNLYIDTKRGKDSTKDIVWLYKPHVILAPSSNVLIQWADLITSKFRNLDIIIGFGESAPRPAYGMRWVSAVAMRNFEAGKPDTLKRWPTHLQYVFNQSDARAGSTIILSTYETLSERIVETQLLSDPKNPEQKVTNHRNRWSGAIDTIVMDEGHKLRHPGTKTANMIKGFNAKIHWFITATPTVNSILDILGVLDILWNSYLSEIKGEPTLLDWMTEESNKGYQGFTPTSLLPIDDQRRLMFLHPKRVESLLQSTADTKALSELFPLIDDLIILRRSTGSEIALNGRDILTLKALMPPYEVKTVMIEYKPEEEAEAQWQHRAHARCYVNAVKQSIRGFGTASRLAATKKNFPPTTQYLRRLCISSASTLLGRFDMYLRRFGMNTLVHSMDKFRQKGGNLDWFLSIVHCPAAKDPPITTHADKLVFLCQGSPKARALALQARDYMMPVKAGDPWRQILFAEDTVPVAWLWELFFAGLFIETGVLHAQLSHQERIQIVNDFNDPDKPLAALFTMYGVSVQGTNFHRSCYRVVVITPAVNAPTEIQLWGRAIRIGQKNKVTVIRFKIVNSHDQFRDAKQADKHFMELLSRSSNQAVQSLMVELLNENDAEIVTAHDEQARKTVEGVRPSTLAAAFDLDTGELVAAEAEEPDDDIMSPVPEDNDVGMGDDEREDPAANDMLRRSGRKRKPVTKLDTEFLTSDVYRGNLGAGEDSDEEPSPKKPRTGNSKGKGKAAVGSSYQSEDVSNPSDSEDYEESDDDEPESGDSGHSAYEESEDENAEDEEDELSRIQLFSELSLDNSTVRELRSRFWRLDKEMMETFDQDDLNERNLLRFTPGKVYNIEDLEEGRVLERGIRLLFQARFGQETGYWRISPHIKYTALPERTSNAIEAHFRLDEKELNELRGKLRGKLTRQASTFVKHSTSNNGTTSKLVNRPLLNAAKTVKAKDRDKEMSASRESSLASPLSSPPHSMLEQTMEDGGVEDEDVEDEDDREKS